MLDSRYSDASAKAKVVPKPGITKEFGSLQPTCDVCRESVGPEDFLSYTVDSRGKAVGPHVIHKKRCDVYGDRYSRQLNEVFDFKASGGPQQPTAA